MKDRRAALAGLLCLVAAAGCAGAALESPAAPEPPPCDAATNERIVAHVREAAASIETLSGRVVLRRCGATIFDEVYGLADRDTGAPVTRAMLFDVGSLTKQLVAAAILDLRDRGKLLLTDRLGAHLHGLPERTASITLHQLLTHASGLPLYSGADYDPVSRDDFLQWLRAVELEYEPGEGEAYSNPGFTTLALVVERVSGQSLESYLQARLLRPAGIESTGYRMVSGPLAINYTADGTRDGTPVEHAWAPDGPYWNLMGGGGILSTADDMARWFEALHGGRVLSARSTEEMFTGHAAREGDEAVRHGYGWRIMEDEHGRWINHGGSNGASYFADVRWFEHTDTLMVMTLNTFDVETIRPLVRGFAEVAGAPADPP